MVALSAGRLIRICFASRVDPDLMPCQRHFGLILVYTVALPINLFPVAQCLTYFNKEADYTHVVMVSRL